jgi:Flp pilus assembly protein TadD
MGAADPRGQWTARRTAALAVVALVALGAAGCNKKGSGDPSVTGSIGSTATPGSADAWRSYADEWGRRYEAKPGEKQASLNYARALSALDQRQQAVAVLQAAAIKAPKDTDILAAYGKALLENGDFQQAQEVLAGAHTPDRPDWRILSAQGVAADQLGDHASAQNLYNAALKISPDEPGVLTNLGLSYALSKRLPEAEATLRRAAALPNADARVRQNLALVLSLQGKHGEAETIARRDQSPVEAAQSVTAMKDLSGASQSKATTRPKPKKLPPVAQGDPWTQIRSVDAKAPRGPMRLDEAAGLTTVPQTPRTSGAPVAAVDEAQ